MSLRADLLWQGERADALGHLAAMKAKLGQPANRKATSPVALIDTELTERQRARALRGLVSERDTFLDSPNRIKEE
jgi:hypothetical protein